MLFMTVDKIDSPVDVERCHFILDDDDGDLPWKAFLRERPIAFCVGCENRSSHLDATIARFEDLGLGVIRGNHKTLHTAFIARNQRFISEIEIGMERR